MRKKIICFLVTALIVSTSPAFGAVKEGSFSLSPLIGGYIYDNDQQFNSNLVLGVRAGYNITKAIGVEALYDYATPTDSKFWSLKDISLHRFGGQALYHFFPDNLLVPYLAAGFSGVKFNGSGVNPKTHSAFDYGAGAKYSLTDGIAVRADVRHVLYSYNSSTFNNVEFTLGAHFQFGGTTPAVKTMMPVPVPEPVKEVAVPTTPSPGPVKVIVVPASAPEPVKMVVAPVPVSPADPEPIGAAVDAKASPVVVAKRSCEKLTITTVLFDASKASVKVRYYKVLDKMGNFLKKFPNSKGTIKGYTDADGSKKTNLKLSRVRAENLRSHIIYKFGIDGSRISAKGYGSAKPIASNSTDSGKAKNRRIEAVFNCE